jgi:hypothetical protein
MQARPSDWAADLVDWGDRSVLVSAGEQGWQVTPRPADAVVRVAGGAGRAQARVGGEPAAVLLWLYNRVGDGDVIVVGDTEMIARSRRLLAAGTGIS